MIASMTGYGRGEAAARGIAIAVELRSVNSRFLEIATRLPRSLSLRENDIKEVLRQKVSRGKITVVAVVERDTDGELPLKVNVTAARTYYKLLNQLRRAVKLKEPVKLDHLLRFSEVIQQGEIENRDEQEWEVFRRALTSAAGELQKMRENEGAELRKDFEERIRAIERHIDEIERRSQLQIPQERERLRERVAQLVSSEQVDPGRLETELALLADRLDVTEECVRFRSHNKFFLEALRGDEAAGRKLNFLVQEMHREINTIGSKSSMSEIAHLVVRVKEELEKIREQLQNIE
jgi:uncharacterized protein (TIGR00255 family)